MTNQQERKQAIRAFLQTAGDVQLAALLAECRDGKFNFNNPCHCLRGVLGGGTLKGYHAMRNGYAAEDAIYDVGVVNARFSTNSDAARRSFLIPVVRAEMLRREKLRPAREVASPEISSVYSNHRATARVAQ